MQNNISGIIVLNKQKDWTSHDCVAVMRRLISVKRIGHTGTLDPMAEGVLPICIGTATRIMEYLDIDFKTYLCTMKLGIITDTEDIWGNILVSKDVSNVKEEDIRKVCSTFIGEITQIPPKYSALKVNGKKLYEYARAGEDVTIKSRKITIKDFQIKEIDGDEITFEVTCSKGTYVRTICNDIGEALGVGGAMSKLTRTKSGKFNIDESITIDELREKTREEILEMLLPPEYPLVHFGVIRLQKEAARDFVNGKKMNTQKRGEEMNKELLSGYDELYKIYYKDTFLGVARIEDEILIADKVFNVEIQNEDI